MKRFDADRRMQGYRNVYMYMLHENAKDKEVECLLFTAIM